MLSQGKPTTQSSVVSRGNVPLTSDKAFDGNLNQYNSKLSCMHTKLESEAWLQVDLLQNALIHSTRIYNRRDCCQERLSDALILVSNDETFLSNTLCAKFASITTVDQIQTFYCAPNIFGRYVRLEIPMQSLQICEMQVFGHYMWLILLIINIPWNSIFE